MADTPDRTVRKPGPNIRQRQVATALRQWRLTRGWTQEEFAARLGKGWSQAKLVRYERCEKAATVVDVGGFAMALGVSDEERDRVVALVRAGEEGLVWWRAYGGGVGDAFADFVMTEADATEISNFEASLIPGLLQTPDYTDALIREWIDEPDEQTIERRRDLRARRQARVTEAGNPVDLHVVICEAALLPPVGSLTVMAAQLDHLLAVGALPNVTVQILPTDVGAYPGFGSSFHLMTFERGAEPAAAYAELLTSGLYIESDPDVQAYSLTFRRLKHLALDPEASARRIANRRDQLT